MSGIVSISTGPNTRVAVEPHLNWALATPGTLGSLGIVDLNQQSSNAITAISRTNNGIGTNVVTVSVQSTASSPPLSVQVGDAVQIQNIQFPVGHQIPRIAALAPGFNGFYAVSSVGPGPNQFSYNADWCDPAECGDSVGSAGRRGSCQLFPAGSDRRRADYQCRGLESIRKRSKRFWSIPRRAAGSFPSSA